MNHLLRGLAPIPASAWAEIDKEARERLTPLLGARRVVDWSETGGWAQSAVNLGRTTKLDGLPGMDADGERVRQRQVLPLAEVRVPFTLDRAELDDVERGAADLKLDDLDRAARRAAEIENRVVFHGWPAAGICGIIAAAPHPVAALGEDVDTYPTAVATAVETLRCAGIEGPYALAVGPATYTRIVAAAERGGHLLLDHLARILGGNVVWTPGLDAAVLLSQRGGDFVLDVGQDLAIGYSHHNADTIDLYLEQSFTFRSVEPDAAVVLTT